MELKTFINLAINLMSTHFTLCGVSVSVMEILIYFSVAAILVGLIRGIML